MLEEIRQRRVKGVQRHNRSRQYWKGTLVPYHRELQTRHAVCHALMHAHSEGMRRIYDECDLPLCAKVRHLLTIHTAL